MDQKRSLPEEQDNKQILLENQIGELNQEISSKIREIEDNDTSKNEKLQEEQIAQNNAKQMLEDNDQNVSIYKIQKSFNDLNDERNLIRTLNQKAKIVISEFQIFFQNLEIILKCDVEKIDCIKKLGQKLLKEYVQAFHASNMKKLIYKYLSDPNNSLMDQEEIKSEFIRFANQNEFQKMIEEDTDYESDADEIFKLCQDQILSNQFQDILQVQDLSESFKDDILKAYSLSEFQEMVCIYQKVQTILQGQKDLQKEQQPNVENQVQESTKNNQSQNLEQNIQTGKSENNIKSIQIPNNKEQNIQLSIPSSIKDNENNSKPNQPIQFSQNFHDDRQFQRKKSEQLEKQQDERNKLVLQLQQNLKPGEYAPKNSNFYNQFINGLADLISNQKSTKEIEEFLIQNINDSHVQHVFKLVSEISDKSSTSNTDNKILKKIKENIPLFSEALNNEQIFQIIQEMKTQGYQSNFYQECNQGNQSIDKKMFDIHMTHSFINEKTYQVCQNYFKIANFELSEKESQIVLDRYFINILKYEQDITQNLIKFQQIDKIISSNPNVKNYIERVYSLSLKKIILALFSQDQNQLKDKFLYKKLVNKENSAQKLQKFVEKQKINKDHKDFSILEQIYSANNFISLYFKSLLMIEINQPKDDQQLYFFEIFKFLQEIQNKGLEVLSNIQNQQIVKLLKIDQNILNAKDFEKLDYFYIQIFELICADSKNKINAIEFVLRKELSMLSLVGDQLSQLSKQIYSTGLAFVDQLNEQKISYAKEIDQKLSKCSILKTIYGQNLYEAQDQNLKFYFDFENEMILQSQRDELFKISKCIDVNQLLEYHNSSEKTTQIEAWIKNIVDLYTNLDPLFPSKLYDLIIYLSKRNQNLDFIFQKIKELLLKSESKQSRFLINKKIVFEYLIQYSDAPAQLKLILMLGFANPVPLLITKIQQIQNNQFKFQQKLSYQSFWLLKNSDKVVASFGIGFQKGKSTLLNEVFATNFEISDGSYSFVGSADIQSNHIFQQNKRKYFIADFHGDATQLDEQYILGFFVYYILQINVKLIQGNKINELERIVKLLEDNNKKFCILIRDFEENNQKQQYYSKNDNLAYQKFQIPLLENKNTLILPNLKIVNQQEKKYHLNQARLILDSFINEQSDNMSSQNLFIERFFTQESQQNQNQIFLTYQSVDEICRKLEKNQDLKIYELFNFYNVFSKYQKKKMEFSDWRFKISNDSQIQERNAQFELFQHQYFSLNIKEDSQRSTGATLFEQVICDSQNFYQKMLFFIQRLKEVNFKKVGNLKEKKRNLVASSRNKDDIEKQQQDLDQQILDNQISVELFWREIIQLWSKHTNYSKNDQIIEAYASMISQGFPFEIIDGETFYYPYEFLQKCFSHGYFNDKKICIISIIGPQNSGKSTLLNYFLGCDFYVSDGRCTRGIYGTLVKSKIPEFDYILVIDSEGLLSQEKDDPDYDRKLTLFCLTVSQFLIINVKDQLTPEMTKILELCVEVSQELKANKIPKRVVEIVFNQKADPNNDNNKVAINNALKSFERNDKLSDHIEISHENATNLSTAFSYKYIDLGDQQNNWSYLETQITFVEGVQKLGDKIIQKLISLSEQEQQKNFKIVKSIPELLKLMKDIYETILQNSDLIAFKDILHKQNDLEVKQFIKKQINEKMDNKFQQNINQAMQNSQEQSRKIKIDIDDEFNLLESHIQQSIDNQFKSKVSHEIITQNFNYLNQQLEMQKDNYLNNFYQDRQEKSIKQQIDEFINTILNIAKKSSGQSMNQQIQQFNNLFDDEINKIEKQITSEDQRSKQSFQYIQGNYKLKLKENLNIQHLKNFNEQIEIKEIIKVGQGLLHYLDPTFKNQQFEQIIKNQKFNLINSQLLYKIFQIICVRIQFCKLEKINFGQIGYHKQKNHQFYNQNQSQFQQTMKRLNNEYGIVLNEPFILGQFNFFKQSNDLIDFSNVGNSCTVNINSKQIPNLEEELNRIYDIKKHYIDENYLKWYNKFVFWTTSYDKQKNELEQQKQGLKIDNSCSNCFISWLKEEIKRDYSDIFNFEQFIQQINEQIKQNIDNQNRSKVDQELIMKIASIVQQNIQEANQNLKIYDLELSAQAENRINMLAIYQLQEQDINYKKQNLIQPLEQLKKQRKEYERYFLEYASKDQALDKQSAISFKIQLYQFCQDKFNKLTQQIIKKSLEEYESQLSKEQIIKGIQSGFYNITQEKAQEYINDPNKTIFEAAKAQSKIKIEKTNQQIDDIKKQIINSVQVLLSDLSKIKSDQLLTDKKNENLVASNIFIKKDGNTHLPDIENSQIAFQKFIFQILLDEQEEIKVKNDTIIVDLQRPKFLKVNDQQTKLFISQFIHQNEKFFNSLQISSLEQFYDQLQQIVSNEQLYDNINKFQTLQDIQKEFFAINDYLTCELKCPCCGQICDQDHWKFNQDPRGSGQNKHTVKCGHRFAAFNGVKIDKENIPALITCSDYDNNTCIQFKKQLYKWSKFKDDHSQWDWSQAKSNNENELSRFNWQKLWSLLGRQICSQYNIKYEEVCNATIIKKCKEQVPPMHFIIAFDESGSMNGKSWQDLKSQLENFIKLRFDKTAQDVCSLIGFDNKAIAHATFEQLNLKLLDKIPQNNRGGGTNFSTVFDLIIKLLEHEKSQNFIENTIIFFLSDGEAEYPEQQIQQLQKFNNLICEIQFVGYGNNNFQILTKMQQQLKHLNAMFQKVLDEQQLQQQFTGLSLIIPG